MQVSHMKPQTLVHINIEPIEDKRNENVGVL